MRVAIEGLIGAGKSTFAKLLGECLKTNVLYESVSDNPFIEHYYANPSRWAYTTQMYFLYNRYSQHKEESFVLDRSIYGDSVFAALQLSQGLMTQAEYDCYLLHQKELMSIVAPIDFCIYLDTTVDVAHSRIVKRARGFETAIEKSYLEGLSEEYKKLKKCLPEETNWLRLDWNLDRDLEGLKTKAAEIAEIVRLVCYGHIYIKEDGSYMLKD